jgi:hypothetical protein
LNNQLDHTLQDHLKVEKRLYEPTLHFVTGQFLSHRGLNVDGVHYTAEITAQGGAQGGKYSAPDVTLIISRKHTYVPVRTVQIFSFEVKTEDGGNADAVLEAAAHLQQTHFAYVVWHLPHNSPRNARLARVNLFARKFGVGLIIVRAIALDGSHVRFDEVQFLAEPEPRNPSPELVDSYVEDRFSGAYKEKIKSWLPKEF